jgi:hypothetical protein
MGLVKSGEGLTWSEVVYEGIEVYNALVILDLVGVSGLSVYVVYMILSVQAGWRFGLGPHCQDVNMKPKSTNVLVFVDLAELILVAAFELPEVAFAEPDEGPAVAVALEEELVVFLHLFSHAFLLHNACDINARRRTLRQGMIRRERDPKVQVAEPEQVRRRVKRCRLARVRAG